MKNIHGNEMPFTFYSAPDHGWFKVYVSDLLNLGLTESSFSRYSFKKRENTGADYMLLEEDCDAGKFLDAYKATHGSFPEIREQMLNGRHEIGL